jgi:hypothetical protein
VLREPVSQLGYDLRGSVRGRGDRFERLQVGQPLLWSARLWDVRVPRQGPVSADIRRVLRVIGYGTEFEGRKASGSLHENADRRVFPLRRSCASSSRRARRRGGKPRPGFLRLLEGGQDASGRRRSAEL